LGPDLHYAHLLRQDRQTDLPAILEARILAGQDDQAIARTVGTIPEVIDSYELLFFHVRDRLDVEDWVLQIVLAGEMRGNAVPTATQHKRLLYRLAGYAGGPQALKQVLSGTRGIQRNRQAAAGGNWCERELTRTLRFKGLQAARLVEVTSENALAIIGLMLKLVERERLAARQDGEGESTPLDMARSVFGTLKLMMGDEAYQNASPELRAVLDSPFEPRLRDQLRLSKCAGGLHGQLAEMEAEYDEQREADGPQRAEPTTEP
jgi:hypothetical protein